LLFKVHTLFSSSFLSSKINKSSFKFTYKNTAEE
jgi:hypothetical protein